MLSKFNEKRQESKSKEFNISHHFYQKSNMFTRSLDYNKFNFYNTLNDESKVKWENMLNPPRNMHLQPISQIELLSYKDILNIDIESQEKLKLTEIKEDEIKKEDVKRVEKTNEKKTMNEPMKPDQSKPIQTLKIQCPRRSSKVHWSVNDSNDDDDSLDLSIFEHDNQNRLQLIYRLVFRLKTVLLIISIIGLVYQTLELSETYFRYPTIT